MNTYTKNITESAEQKLYHTPSAPNRSPFFRVVFQVACICILFFCAIALRVFLTAKIERMNKATARLTAQIGEYELECYHLRSKKAKLTALNYITGKVKAHKLGLRSADYRQVQVVALLPEKSAPIRYKQDSSERKARTYVKMPQVFSVGNSYVQNTGRRPR